MKNVISTVATFLGGAILFSAAAVNVSSTSELSNTATYFLSRQALTAQAGLGYVQAVEGQEQLVTLTSARTDKEDPMTQWSIHYSEREKQYYIYNLGTGQFLTGDTRSRAVTTDAAVDSKLLYNEDLKYWMLDCGGYLLGLADSYSGKALFVDDFAERAQAREMGCYFILVINEDRTLTAEESDAIEAKIAAGREAKLAEYREFLEDTKNVTTNQYIASYLGEYDNEELEYALENESKYTLSQIEEIYQQTILSRFPKAGHYYRLHNRARPGNYRSNNLSTLTDGTVVSRPLSEPGFGTAGEGYTDDLCLVRFIPVGGDPTQVKIQMASTQTYLKSAANGQQPEVTSSGSDAYTFELETVSARSRNYRFVQPTLGNWLTVASAVQGEEYAALNGYNQRETPMQWYIEEVDTIWVPVDANGYATVCLPCGVGLPEGVKAYTVTDFSGNRAYVEEISSPIHLSTPWIVKAPAGATSVGLPVENNTNYVYSAMAGNMIAAENVGGRYVPTFSADGIKFAYEPASERVLPGTCYIVSEDKGEITTVMGGNPDAGIEEITTDQAGERELYDLLGRPVSGTPVPGIYINAATKQAIRIK